MRTIAIAVLSLTLLAGCGPTDAPTSPDGEPMTVESISDTVKASVSDIESVEELTEDNDPNELIGRPNGYVAGAVFYDSRLECDELGVGCGATLEQWDSAEDAQERSDYILGILEESPMLGSEYNYLLGPYLLRVSGDLAPSEAEEYEDALRSLDG